MGRPDHLHLLRSEGRLRQEEKSSEDFRAENRDLCHRPDPATRRGGWLGRRRGGPPASLRDGADRHSPASGGSRRLSIAGCERCRSLNRSMASSTRRSISFGYDRPEASQSLGYMLIRVKPGMVLSSFTSRRLVVRSRKKSTRAMPAASTAWKARSARLRASCATTVSTGAGISNREPSSRYFAS